MGVLKQNRRVKYCIGGSLRIGPVRKVPSDKGMGRAEKSAMWAISLGDYVQTGKVYQVTTIDLYSSSGSELTCTVVFGPLFYKTVQFSKVWAY